jgi:putative component of membrane protein insertase Oxa1/YidC/SpoIIIJ protein YidD
MRKWLSNSLFVVCYLLSVDVNAQQSKTDNEFLQNQNFSQQKFETKRKVTFLLSKKKNLIVRYNPVSLTFGGLLFMYQKFLSPQISNNCPYNPSCSGFSKNSILTFGLMKGIALSADRLTRCNSIAAHDISFLDFKNGKIDDAPEKYRLRK